MRVPASRRRAARGRARVSLARPPRRTVAVVDDLQSLQGQLRVDLVDVLALFGEQRRESARRNDAFQFRQLALNAREDSVDEAEVAEVEAGLHVGNGVRADRALGAFHVDARET